MVIQNQIVLLEGQVRLDEKLDALIDLVAIGSGDSKKKRNTLAGPTDTPPKRQRQLQLTALSTSVRSDLPPPQSQQQQQQQQQTQGAQPEEEEGEDPGTNNNNVHHSNPTRTILNNIKDLRSAFFNWYKVQQHIATLSTNLLVIGTIP